MIIDGRSLARDIEHDLKRQISGRVVVLAIVFVGDNPVSQKYVTRKKRVGERVGVIVRLYSHPATIAEDELIGEVQRIANDSTVHGIIVQMPLPQGIRGDRILKHIPPLKDVDALGPAPLVKSPVVGAIRHICATHAVSFAGKRVVVVGRGLLVGAPAARFAEAEKAKVTIVDKQTSNPRVFFQEADIIISGAGVPGLIRAEDVHEGVVLIDAATSELNGKLVGDIDTAAGEKASLYTPVPGGIGPLTVVMLFKNLLFLYEKQTNPDQ